MADINIERKGNSIWPWVLGLILLAVVVFVVMQYRNGGADEAGVTSGDSTQVQQSPQFQPAPVSPPAAPDSIPGDSARRDSMPGMTTSAM